VRPRRPWRPGQDHERAARRSGHPGSARPGRAQAGRGALWPRRHDPSLCGPLLGRRVPMRSTGPTRVIVLGPAAPVRGGMAAVVDALNASSLSTHFELAVLNTGKPTPEDRPWHIAVSSQLRLFRKLAAMLA